MRYPKILPDSSIRGCTDREDSRAFIGALLGPTSSRISMAAIVAYRQDAARRRSALDRFDFPLVVSRAHRLRPELVAKLDR